MMILKKLCILPVLVLLWLQTLAQEFPAKPAQLVNDYTRTLSEEQRFQLENKLRSFEDSTSIQIAVVLIESVGVYDVDDYAVRLAENWGIGQQGKNNGILLLAAMKDRKVTIQTGYGLEGALPDAIAAQIRLNEINPNFKAGNYFAGLDRATDAIIAYTKGEYKNDTPKKQGNTRKFPLGLIIIIIVIILLISRGGGGGKGGQIIGSRGGSSLFWWTLMSGMGSRGRGGFGGGGFGGGGFGGGGFGGGGGGFGGFGGGSFGGGGSGGSW